MKAILQKLYGNNKRSTSVKAELKSVKLNKINDLYTDIDVFRDKINETEQLSDEAYSYYNSAFDILKNAYSEFEDKKTELQNLVEQLNELGVDSAEIDDLETKFYGIEQEFNGLFSNFENLGFYS
jgi:predicted  nucleic acid-binding Zn-ribbon protein